MSSVSHSSGEIKMPLCVDLDGTLIKTDSLHELIIKLIKQKVWVLFLLPFWIFKGKAEFKSKIAQQVSLAGDCLPYDEQVLGYIEQQKAAGRELYLCTGANERVAKTVASHLGIFDGVIASDDSRNITGSNKAAVLNERFGPGAYAYIGNHSVDYAVWASAGDVLAVNPSQAFLDKVQQKHAGATLFKQESFTFKELLKAARVHQWVKNTLLFVPLLLDHKIATFGMFFAAMLGFLSFSLMASATYFINDLLDLEADRVHHKKKHRAFASGKLSASSGLLLIVILFAISFSLLFVLPAFFAVVALIYLGSTLLYSFHIKTMVILDTTMLAGLFTVRVVGGTALIGAAWSFWLFAFSMFLFLSLAFAKRASELNGLKDRNGKSAAGRGYIVEDIPLVTAMGVSSGYVAVLVVALYINSEKVTGMYDVPEFLWLICPLLLYWIGRVWLKTVRCEMNEDPIIFAIKDRISHITGILCFIVLAFASWAGRYGQL